MSKLFELKVWLSLDGAAKRLSKSFGEEVSEVDIIQMALDGHLRLSIRLLVDHLYALRWYKKPESEIEYEEVEYHLHEGLNSGQPAFTRLEPIDGGEVIYLPEFCSENERLQLGTIAIAYARDYPGRDVVDLPLTRYSRVFLLQYLDMLSRPSESAQYDTARLLIQEESGNLWQVESYNDFLLDDIELVVRTQALRDLEKSLSSAHVAGQLAHKELSPSKERTYLHTIGALLAYIKGELPDVPHPKYTSETELREFLGEKYKSFTGMSPRTLADNFKKAKDFLNK